MHLGESLHGGGDLGTGHLLVEGVDEPVRARALIQRHGEGVKLGIQSVRLRAEAKTPRHTQLERAEKTPLKTKNWVRETSNEKTESILSPRLSVNSCLFICHQNLLNTSDCRKAPENKGPSCAP